MAEIENLPLAHLLDELDLNDGANADWLKSTVLKLFATSSAESQAEIQDDSRLQVSPNVLSTSSVPEA